MPAHLGRDQHRLAAGRLDSRLHAVDVAPCSIPRRTGCRPCARQASASSCRRSTAPARASCRSARPRASTPGGSGIASPSATRLRGPRRHCAGCASTRVRTCSSSHLRQLEHQRRRDVRLLDRASASDRTGAPGCSGRRSARRGSAACRRIAVELARCRELTKPVCGLSRGPPSSPASARLLGS